MIEAPMYRQAIPQREYEQVWETARQAELAQQLAAIRATMRALRCQGYDDGPPLWRAAIRDDAQRAIAALPTREPPPSRWRRAGLVLAHLVVGLAFPVAAVIVQWPR